MSASQLGALLDATSGLTAVSLFTESSFLYALVVRASSQENALELFSSVQLPRQQHFCSLSVELCFLTG